MEPGFSTNGFRQYQSGLHNETFDKVIEAIENLNKVIANDDALGAGFVLVTVILQSGISQQRMAGERGELRYSADAERILV